MRWQHNGIEHEYEHTEEDSLVLARAVAREGKPADAVAFALCQRFAFLYPHESYPTLASLVSAYSQPINPRWFPDGDLHRRKLQRLQGQEAAIADEKRRAENRIAYAEMPWEELSDGARRAALQAIDGDGNPCPFAVHFSRSFAPKNASDQEAKRAAHRWADNRNLKVVPVRGGYRLGINWFFTVPAARGLRLMDMEEDLVPTVREDPAFPPPPPDAPTGAGWGWRWICLYEPAKGDD